MALSLSADKRIAMLNPVKKLQSPLRACQQGSLPGRRHASVVCHHSSSDNPHPTLDSEALSRRTALCTALLAGSLASWAYAPAPAAAKDAVPNPNYEPMAALKGKDYGKPRMRYPDYVMTASGLQYNDIRVGAGEAPKDGDTVVLDWDGYTIGYYGRPFEARNKSKGGSFTGEDKEFLHFELGKHTVIPAFEEAVAGMKVGGIRRIVVPVEIGYPDNDYRKQGPAPSNFSGERALGFVLGNQGMIDKTLLFDLELIRINP